MVIFFWIDAHKSEHPYQTPTTKPYGDPYQQNQTNPYPT